MGNGKALTGAGVAILAAGGIGYFVTQNATLNTPNSSVGNAYPNYTPKALPSIQGPYDPNAFRPQLTFKPIQAHGEIQLSEEGNDGSPLPNSAAEIRLTNVPIQSTGEPELITVHMKFPDGGLIPLTPYQVPDKPSQVSVYFYYDMPITGNPQLIVGNPDDPQIWEIEGFSRPPLSTPPKLSKNEFATASAKIKISNTPDQSPILNITVTPNKFPPGSGHVFPISASIPTRRGLAQSNIIANYDIDSNSFKITKTGFGTLNTTPVNGMISFADAQLIPVQTVVETESKGQITTLTHKADGMAIGIFKIHAQGASSSQTQISFQPFEGYLARIDSHTLYSVPISDQQSELPKVKWSLPAEIESPTEYLKRVKFSKISELTLIEHPFSTMPIPELVEKTGYPSYSLSNNLTAPIKTTASRSSSGR